MLLKFAFQEFLCDRELKNVSSTTITHYKDFFKLFGQYCTEQEIINAEDVTTGTIKSFLLVQKNERGNNPTTINTKLKHLKAFFNFLEQEEIIPNKQNPTKRIQKAKEEIKIEVFSDNHIKQMLGYYRRLKYRDKSFFSVRDHSIILFLLGTGVRLGELVNLKWQHVLFDQGIITVYGKKREYSSIPMSDKLKKEMREYKIFSEQTFDKLPEYVFTNTKGKKLSENSVKCMFKRLKDIMNFSDVRLSAHTFRHSFANRCLLAGMDVFSLQKLLRHSKLQQTERYLAIWGTALHEQNEKYNPLNNLDI